MHNQYKDDAQDLVSIECKLLVNLKPLAGTAGAVPLKIIQENSASAAQPSY